MGGLPGDVLGRALDSGKFGRPQILDLKALYRSAQRSRTRMDRAGFTAESGRFARHLRRRHGAFAGQVWRALARRLASGAWILETEARSRTAVSFQNGLRQSRRPFARAQRRCVSRVQVGAVDLRERRGRRPRGKANLAVG